MNTEPKLPAPQFRSSVPLWKRLLPPWTFSRPTYHFIHIPKNAGQSVRAALARRKDVSLIAPFHYRYVDIADFLPDGLRYFCIIRNPWSRTASRYLFARQSSVRWPADDPRRVYIQQVSFADYVREQKIFEIPEHPAQPWMGPMNSWFNQLDWITDRNHQVRCDCLRFEKLEDDLNAYFSEVIRVPKRNVTRTSYDYRSLYTAELHDIIARTFQRDIEYFGFDSEGSATRNVAGSLGPANSTRAADA